MQCPKCKSEHVYREHRTRADRWRYAAVFKCSDCHHRIGISHVKILSRLSLAYFIPAPWITSHARCPKCGNMQLQVYRNRDYVEGYEDNLLRTIQRLLGAPLCYCWDCRLQFYDLRPRLNPKHRS